ncbi:MFS transporter [Streptomyces sp. NPDC001508]|uniref:MFS transporter n=1 Tax=Streptomyces sp. NPDC001508 TaxID=3154656 RepID=UPI00331E76C2
MTGLPAVFRTAERPVPGRYWKLATLSGMASYLDSGLLIAISVSLAIWRDSFGMGVWMTGAISAIVTFCIAIGSLVGGRLADLFGRRRVYNADILCYAGGVTVMTFAPNDIVLLGGLVIAGLAAGADLPTSLAVVSQAAPAWARGRLIAFTQVMWSVGITVTIALGYVLSGLGALGTRIIVGHLAVAAVVTWFLRARLRVPEDAEADGEPLPKDSAGGPGGSTAVLPQGTHLRNLLKKSILVPMAATFFFYVAWGLGANTFGQFGTYFLVTVSDASQSVATGLSLAFLPVTLLMTVVFVRYADTPWRDRLFLVAGGVQIVAFAIPSLTGGASLAGMVAYLILYQLSSPLAGEANYKVWSQLTLPPDTRGTSQGLTYALARAAFAVAAFFTPALLEYSAGLLLWSITACAAISMVVGVYIVRVLIPTAAAAVVRPNSPTEASAAAQPAPASE